MNIRPLHDRIVVEVAKSEEKRGSIFLPDSAQKKPHEGKVLAVGNGTLDGKGKRTPLGIKPGDRIVYGQWSGSEVKIDGNDYLILRESDVLGVVDGAAKVSVRAAAAAGAAGAAATACPLDHIHDGDCCDD
ncbi:MAG: hypothetical protein RLZ98_2764 [Pseudomonadota bacterium]|jgi:chaperonin GroES